MEYPLYIDGNKSGKLTVTQKGLMTVFCAECPDIGKVTRISVFGDGKSYLLGVLLPDRKGMMRVERSLSRNALQSLPLNIEYAADREIKPPSPAPPDKDGLLWFSSPDGTLTAFDGRQSLIALPSDGVTAGMVKTINGREYAIFPGKRKHKTVEK